MSNHQPVFELIVYGSLFIFVLIFFLVKFLVSSREKAIQHQLQLQQVKNQLLQAHVEVQEQALQFVSMEIHDHVCQGLSISRMLLTSAMETNPLTSGLQLQLDETVTQIGKSIDDLRNISHTLSGKMVEQIGLAAAIEKEITYFNSLYRLECRLEQQGKLPALNNMQTILLFRITQEALQNVAKHSGATKVIIGLHQNEDVFILSIADNGKGIGGNKGKSGMGLVDMEERARLLKGKLEMGGTAGGGCTLRIHIHLNNI